MYYVTYRYRMSERKIISMCSLVKAGTHVSKLALNPDFADIEVTSEPPEPENVEAGTWWQHYNGKYYYVEIIANVGGDTRYPVTVVYRDVHGKVWARPLSNWHRSMTFVPNSDFGLFYARNL